MIIENLRITNFGKFKDASFSFGSGVNMIEGDNESGKSTLADFIVFIFYGLSDEKTPFGSEKEKYLGTARKIGGSLTLSCPKGRFRIERSIDRSEKSVLEERVNIVDLSIDSPIRGRDPAALFLGIPRETFERSCLMAQLEKRSVCPVDLGRAVENMLSSADESINAQKAVEKLEEKIGSLSSGADTPGSIASKRERVKDLELRKEAAVKNEEEYKKLQESLKDNTKKTESNKRELAVCEKRAAHAEAQQRLQRIKKAGQANTDHRAALDAFEKAKEELVCDGFLPDRAYTQALSSTLAEALRLSSLLQSAETRRSENEQKLSDLPEPVGGKEGQLLGALQESGQKRSANKNYMLLSAGGAGLMLFLTILFIVLKILPGAIVCGVLTLVGAALALWFYLRFRDAVNKENALYASAGAENKEQLAEAVERNARLTAEREALQRIIAEETARIEKSENDYFTEMEKGDALAKRWGRSAASIEELKEVSIEAEEAYERLEQLSKEEKQTAITAEHLTTETSEKELRELVGLLRSDGINEEITPEEYKDLGVKIKFYRQTSDALDARIKQQKERSDGLLASMEDRYELDEQIGAAKEELANAEHELEVRKAARDLLLESISYMQARILPGIMEDASTFFAGATNGKYPTLSASPDFKVTAVDEKGQALEMGRMSGAMAELCYMALRFGMTGALFRGQPMPMILDESFSSLDDLHLAAAFTAVMERAGAQKNQILLMTCRKRETALMEKIGPVTKIQL